MCVAGWSVNKIAEATKIHERTLKRIKARARQREFEPAKDPRIKEEYVLDGVRSGRPRKQQPVEEQNPSIDAVGEEALEDTEETLE